MAVGGFSTNDPSPTLAQFQGDVSEGSIRYYIASEKHGPDGGDTITEAAKIDQWVTATFPSSTVHVAARSATDVE